MSSTKLSTKIIGSLIILSIFSLAILLSLEFYFRLNPDYARSSFQYDNKLIYRLRKNLTAKKAYAMGKVVPGKTFTIKLNKNGFRGPTPQKSKAKGTTRIMILGDSYTAGLDYPDAEIFTSKLQTALNQASDPIEIINASCPSWSTEQQYLYWITEGHQYQPDYLILMASPNDLREAYNRKLFQIDNKTNELSQKAVWMHWKEITGWWLACNSSLFQYLQKNKLKKTFGTFQNIYNYYPVNFGKEDKGDWDRPLFLTEPFAEVTTAYQLHEALIKKLHASCQDQGTQLCYTMIPIKNEFNGQYKTMETRPGIIADKAKAIATKEKLPYLDLHAALSHKEQPLDIYFDWEYHFDAEGQQFITDELIKFIDTIQITTH